jgi:hypothetical protein
MSHNFSIVLHLVTSSLWGQGRFAPPPTFPHCCAAATRSAGRRPRHGRRGCSSERTPGEQYGACHVRCLDRANTPTPPVPSSKAPPSPSQRTRGAPGVGSGRNRATVSADGRHPAPNMACAGNLSPLRRPRGSFRDHVSSNGIHDDRWPASTSTANSPASRCLQDNGRQRLL